MAQLFSLGHMSVFTQGSRCEKCGGTGIESLVQHGSYFSRCAACQTHGAATSWIAVGPKWNEAVRVFRDGDETGTPLLEGIGSQIWQEIRRLAADGTTLILR